MMNTNRQNGIALVTAIFVVALATIAAVAMFEAANVAIHRSANVAQSETEWWYGVGAESWVKGVLIADAKLNAGNNNQVALNGLWAQEVALPIEGGGIRGHIEDLQGRFNLNNIGIGPLTNTNTTANPTGALMYIQQFDRLLDSLPNFDASKYHGIGFAIRDWIDADDQRSGTEGAEDQDYLSLDPPYRAANRPMTSPSELLLVRGMTKELYAALAPYVTALPTATAINVNTAPGPVLMSLATNINQSALQQFIQARKTEPMSNTGTLPFLPTGAQSVPTTTTSTYFEMQAQVFIGSGRLALYSVFYRPTGGAPVVIAHSTNTE
jgi:general secretion pathway protein K